MATIQIMIFFIFIICGITFLAAALAYWILGKYDSKVLFVVSLILGIVSFIITNQKIITTLGLISGIFSSAITTAILTFLYNKINSFWKFVGMLLLLEISLMLPAILFLGIIMSFLEGLGNAMYH